VTRKIAIGKGWQLKNGKLVPDYKHLPVNIQLQKRASKRVRKSTCNSPSPLLPSSSASRRP